MKTAPDTLCLVRDSRVCIGSISHGYPVLLFLLVVIGGPGLASKSKERKSGSKREGGLVAHAGVALKTCWKNNPNEESLMDELQTANQELCSKLTGTLLD